MSDKSGGSQLSALKRAYLALEEMEAKLDAARRCESEPIAVIGMACRFPGGVDDLQSYWRLLQNGVDAVIEIPQDRWSVEAYYDPDPKAPGKTIARRAGFVNDVDKFDPQFFGIAPREAIDMDPQQRFFLEVTWEALENAGQAPDKLSGSSTSVFCANSTSDYSDLRVAMNDLTRFDTYYATGIARSVMSGRLSYILGLEGPSVTVDTGCSSSLTAIHLACQSLRTKESRMAIAGGANVILMPHLMVAYSKAGMCGADGRCKTFDASADSFVRGEGCGMVILKRLSDAVADGDRIDALIRGSAVNQDGASSGLTAPNGRAQIAVIRKALLSGGIDPLTVGYVEAHGTGTSLGDPIEVQALGAALCEGRSKQSPLVIGSVKTNFGHLEAASGVAGFIKTVLVLQHGEIPPSLHFHTPNPHIPWNELPIAVPTERMQWPTGLERRIAGVSAFGFGGTNAHVVLEEAPQLKTEKAEFERPMHLLVLSAKNEKALKELASRYESHLAKNPSESMRNFCFSANKGRAHFTHRVAMIATSRESFREQLCELSSGRVREGSVYQKLSHADRPSVAFLFTGQGSQYVGMGRRLYDTQPTFRKTLDRCDTLLRPHLERSLLSVLYPEGSDCSLIDETAYTQPLLFALEYSLSELWRSWGISPSAVMGHSIGEYVAACVAGVFSLESALKLVALRGRLIQELPVNGAMAAVFAGEQKVAATIQSIGLDVSIAAINGPENTVISGAHECVGAVIAQLEAENIRSQRLSVSHGFHSSLMLPMLDGFYQRASEIQYSQPRIPLISNVSGKPSKDEIAHADYWRDHVRLPVRFSDSVRTLHKMGLRIFVEIGPSPILSGMGKLCLPGSDMLWLPSLRKGNDDWRSLLDSLSALYLHGVSVDWAGFDRDYPRQLVSPPTYPFQRERYWMEQSKPAPAVRSKQPEDGLHPLLGSQLRSPSIQDVIFEARFEKSNPSFIGDYRMCGLALMPATGFIAHAMAAAREVFGPAPHCLEQFMIHQPMAFGNERARTVQLVLSPQVEGTSSFQIFSLEENGSWTVHASGRIRAGTGDSSAEGEVIDLPEVKKRCIQEVEAGDHYAAMQKFCFDLGTSFQGIERLWRAKRECLGRLVLPKELRVEAREYYIHPALLDAANQVMGTILMSETADQDLYLPMGIERYRCYESAGNMLWCHAVIHEKSEKNAQTVEGDISIYNENGKLIAKMESSQFKRVDQSSFKHIFDKRFDDWLYKIAWRPMNNPKVSESSSADGHGNWLIFDQSNAIGKDLAAHIKKRGGRGVLVSEGERFECTDKDHWFIDYKRRADYFELFKHLDMPLRGVIFSGDCASVDIMDMSASRLEEQIQKICGGVLYLVQSMLSSIKSHLPHLCVLTRGAHLIASGDKMRSLVGGALWGLSRVIALEHPELACVLIDRNPLKNHDESGTLFNELCFRDGEDQIAYRNNERHVARLIRHNERLDHQGDAKPTRVENDCLRSDASYLITGGLGSLGLQIAHWMVEKGARHLVLMGRSDPSQEARQRISQLERAGAQILVARGDVAREADVTRTLGEISTCLPALCGVVHAAGVLDDGLLLQQDWERFHKVLAPKANGAWNLHIATREIPLDFFILMSSVATIFPNYGQGSYTTANAFLDTLAHYRRAEGLPALSINWSAWSGGGMAASVDTRERARWAEQGFSPMKPEDALETLGRTWTKETAQLAVMPVEWSKFFRYHAGAQTPPMLSELTPEEIHLSKAQSMTDGGLIKHNLAKETLLAGDPGERHLRIENYFAVQLASILKLPLASLDRQQPIVTMGFDSLMAVELRNLVARDLGIVMPITNFLQGQSVWQLTGMLLYELTASATTPPVSPLERYEKTLTGLQIDYADDGWEEGLL